MCESGRAHSSSLHDGDDPIDTAIDILTMENSFNNDAHYTSTNLNDSVAHMDPTQVDFEKLFTNMDMNIFLMEIRKILKEIEVFDETMIQKWLLFVAELKSQRAKNPEKWDTVTDAYIKDIQKLVEARSNIAENSNPASSQLAGTIQRISRLVRDASNRTIGSFLSQDEEIDELSSLGSSWSDHSCNNSSRQGLSTIPSFLRSFANYMGLRVEETFLCQICYEYVSQSKSFELQNCNHRFCYPCIQNYLKFQVSEGHVYPTCFHQSPGEKPCVEHIVSTDIHTILTPTSWRKYEKFKFNKENINARQCPYCDHSQICKGSQEPSCLCESCGKEFCFIHSNAHIGQSCAEYEKQMVAFDKLNQVMISKISKPCPGCGNSVEKSGGCNQLKCVVCQTSFCWLCGAKIDDSVFPVHFQWWNVGGCPGYQLANTEEQSNCEKFTSYFFRGIFFLIFGPPAFVLAIISSFLCCCCIPCSKIFETTPGNAFTSCICISGYVLLAPVIFILLVLFSPCICIAYCIDPTIFNTENINEQQVPEQILDDGQKIELHLEEASQTGNEVYELVVASPQGNKK